MPTPEFQKVPLTQAHFDSLHRDNAWKLGEVYLDTFEAVHDPLAGKVPGGAGAVHYLIKRTGRSDFPYLLYGPFVGDTAKGPWPSKADVEAFFARGKPSIGTVRAGLEFVGDDGGPSATS